jgi:hypothetical protein
MRTMRILCVLVALFGALGLQAAGPEQNAVVAKVPFAFTVGEKMLPAGVYTIAPGAVRLLWIRGDSWRDSANVLVIPANAGKSRAKGALVFHKYGRSYFLREVWTGGGDQGARIRESKAEREYLRAAVPERVHVAVAAFR